MIKRIIAVICVLSAVYTAGVYQDGLSVKNPVEGKLVQQAGKLEATTGQAEQEPKETLKPITPVPVKTEANNAGYRKTEEQSEQGTNGTEPDQSGTTGEAGQDEQFNSGYADYQESVETLEPVENATFKDENGTFCEDSGIQDEEIASAMEYLGDWTISFYCPCEICCGSWAYGATASGVMPTAWHTVATDGLEFGTILYVDGLGTFEVQDRGTEYGWLDVFVSDHGEALANGLQTRAVYIVR